MVDKDRKRAAKHDVARVAAILRRWDPLGIEPGVAGPADEYDGYAPSLVSLAARGATVEQLAARLGELRAAMLGVPADQGGDAAIAQQLLDALNAPADAPRAPRKPKRSTEHDEGAYPCPSCGESIVVPLDRTAGDEQRYVEDCPVCCNPVVIHVEFLDDDEPPRVWAEAE